MSSPESRSESDKKAFGEALKPPFVGARLNLQVKQRVSFGNQCENLANRKKLSRFY